MAKTIRVRRAEVRDIMPVFMLSNDPVVRVHSIHKAPISWESHVAWFEKAVNNPHLRFFVAETEDGRFVGQIRFNLECECWIVSISISSEFRGKGLTKGILLEAMRQVDGKLVAEIAPDNEASKRLFASVGFVEDASGLAASGFVAFTRESRGE